jgi:hypothetical protein
MKWIVDGELIVVQGSIERAKDIIQHNQITVKLAEDTKASTVYEFFHEKYDTLGSIKASVLQGNKTEVYGYLPQAPETKWLVEYLPRNIPASQLGEPLTKLIHLYAWQIQEGIFDLKSGDLWKIAYSEKKIDWGWERFGLEDLELQKQALAELEKWQTFIRTQRVKEFEQITGVILAQIRDGVSLVVFDGKTREGRFLKSTAPESVMVSSAKELPAPDGEDQVGIGKEAKAVDKLQEEWNKMSPKTKENFKKAWKIWSQMQKAYRKEKLDGQAEDAQPTIKDWETKVTKDLRWNIGESRLRDVKKMGESNIVK